MIRPVDGDLPSGTVTFLFTDIEGSTRLIDELGEAEYVERLAEHRRVLRAAFAGCGGVEVDTQGDALFYAFRNPRDAAAAAALGQEQLSAGPVRVRMGLHTGSPVLTGEGYAGRELHRAARIAAAGHGGQVVVSAATAALLDRELGGLGTHRLKDFDEPVSLFQLGEGRFPPLRTISNTNLPRPASSFVGRYREQAEIVSMLSDRTRLLTVSGPGGSGKTRLAIAAATELVTSLKDGVFWVGLSTLRGAERVTEEIALTLGAQGDLADHIGERDLLLLLDNFEHVVEAAPVLALLLERCPHLKFLVTSRESLRIRGEIDYPLSAMAETEAVELFCTRAQVEPDETIRELCRQLEELPLALELAAARTRVLSPAQILERLSQRLDLFEGGRDADPRQKTLRATIAWSYELLDMPERKLFASLAVFRGGCSLEAAQEVAAADLNTLQSLVEKNLLRHTDERFWFLQTIREYAREQLSGSSEEVTLRRRHALFLLRFAERAADEVESGWHAELLARVDPESDNLRAALEWAFDSGEHEILLRLTAAVCWHWTTRGSYHDLDTWLPRALERGSSPAPARLTVLRASWVHAFFHKQDLPRAAALIPEWRSLALEQGDEHHVLLTMNAEALDRMEAGELEDARRQWITMAERANAVGDKDMAQVAIANQAGASYRAGDYRTSLEQWIGIAEQRRENPSDRRLAETLENCGWGCLQLSDPDGASEYFQECLAILDQLGAVRIPAGVIAAAGLGAALVARGQAARGLTLLGAANRLEQELEGQFFDDREQKLLAEAATTARTQLSEDASAAAWARGQAMESDAITAFAQGE